MTRPLRILMVCAEYQPIAKTGGLADAIAGLSRALAARGHDVRVLLPSYGGVHARLAAAPLRRLDATSVMRPAHRFYRLPHEPTAPSIYLLDSPLFTGPEIYCGDERDATRFMALADAALELGPDIDWQPDVVHCHDWHAGLVPGLLSARRRADDSLENTRSVLTIHNIGFQGVFPDTVLADYDDSYRHSLLGDAPSDSTVNFLRSGIERADWLSAVSPTYAEDIQTEEYGMGLDRFLSAKSGKLTGILNGVEYEYWDPRNDPLIGHRYNVEDLSGKLANRQALVEELGIAPAEREPLIGLVSRLTWQKGIDLIVDAIPGLLSAHGCAFVLLGDGEAKLTEALTALAQRYPDRVSFTRGYDEAFAHRIFAGSDLFLMPSRYEPCGLTQLYSLHYGSIPVVRRTGGLADTVTHFDPVTGLGTGSLFEDIDARGLSAAVSIALGWFQESTVWRRVVRNAMTADFSWLKQVTLYEDMYREVLSA